MKVKFALVKSTVIAMALVCTSGSAVSQDRIQTGKAAIERGDYHAAIEVLRDATKRDKKNPQAFQLLGEAYLKADSLTEAEQALVQARVLDTASARTYELLGDVYAKQRLAKVAADQYKRSTELDSTNATTFLKFAEESRRARQYNDAAYGYLKTLSLDSTNVDALTQLTDIYMRAKQYANAGVLLERLMEMYPDSLSWKIQYVRSMGEIKNYEKGIPVAEEIRSRDSQNADAIAFLSAAARARGDNQAAIEHYQSLHPDSLTVEDLVTYGKALKAVDSTDRSIAVFQQALTADPANCEIPYDLGTTYMKAKRYTEAVTMFDRKIACDTAAGYQFASHLNAAMSLMQLKKFKEAKAYSLKAIEFRPDNVQAWQVLAQINGQLEQVDEEMGAYRKVIELSGANNTNGEPGRYNSQLEEANRMIGVRNLIAATKDENLESAKKKYAVAIDYLKRALQFNPKDCSLNLWTAQSYHNINNKEEAKRYYCRILEVCPKSKEAGDAQKGLEALNLKCGG